MEKPMIRSTTKRQNEKDQNDIFLYPPYSGIAPCVGTAGTVHDAYT